MDLEHAAGLGACDHRQREPHVAGQRRELRQLRRLGLEVHLVGGGGFAGGTFLGGVHSGGVGELDGRVLDLEGV